MSGKTGASLISSAILNSEIVPLKCQYLILEASILLKRDVEHALIAGANVK